MPIFRVDIVQIDEIGVLAIAISSEIEQLIFLKVQQTGSFLISRAFSSLFLRHPFQSVHGEFPDVNGCNVSLRRAQEDESISYDSSIFGLKDWELRQLAVGNDFSPNHPFETIVKELIIVDFLTSLVNTAHDIDSIFVIDSNMIESGLWKIAI